MLHPIYNLEVSNQIIAKKTGFKIMPEGKINGERKSWLHMTEATNNFKAAHRTDHYGYKPEITILIEWYCKKELEALMGVLAECQKEGYINSSDSRIVKAKAAYDAKISELQKKLES